MEDKERRARRRRELVSSGMCRSGCGRSKASYGENCGICSVAGMVSSALDDSKEVRRRRAKRNGESLRVDGRNRHYRRGQWHLCREIGDRLLRRSGGVCFFSGDTLVIGVNLSCDHLLPVCRGGSSDEENLVLVTKRINLMKGSMSGEEFIAHCSYVAMNSDPSALDPYTEACRAVDRKHRACAGLEDFHAFIKVA